MSGVAAAKKLKDLGYTNFEVIEGSHRAGGRVFATTIGNNKFDMGSMVVRAAPNNPVLDLIHRYNITIQEIHHDDWIVRTSNGTDVTDLADQIYEEKWAPSVERLTLSGETDPAQHEYRPDSRMKSAFLKAGWNPNSFIEDAIEYLNVDWKYGYGPEETSAKFSRFAQRIADQKAYGEFFVKDDRGLDTIIRNLLDEAIGNDTDKLRNHKMVRNIEERDDKVTISTNGYALTRDYNKIHTDMNDTFTADYVIVTFSLGVLQSDLVTFKPALPEWKTDAIQQFQMSQYTNIIIQFNASFWDDKEWIVYADGTDAFSIILNMNKIYPGCNVLTMQASNKEAVRIERLSNEDVQQEMIGKLQKIYGSIPPPAKLIVTHYSLFPLFRGAWSNWPPGFAMDSHHALQAPVGRVYFAGEHTSSQYFGYLHGAYQSGETVALKLDKCIQDGVCEKYVPPYAARGCRYTAASNYDRTAEQDDGSCKFTCVSGSQLNKTALPVLFLTLGMEVLLWISQKI